MAECQCFGLIKHLIQYLMALDGVVCHKLTTESTSVSFQGAVVINPTVKATTGAVAFFGYVYFMFISGFVDSRLGSLSSEF